MSEWPRETILTCVSLATPCLSTPCDLNRRTKCQQDNERRLRASEFWRVRSLSEYPFVAKGGRRSQRQGRRSGKTRKRIRCNKLLRRNRLVTRDRQTQGKDRTLADMAYHRNRASVGFCNFLDDGKPKSRATGVFRPCPIGPIKPLEEVRKMFRLDPMACILDRHGDSFSNRLQADGHGSTGRRVAKGVVEEIDQRLFEPLCIAEDRWNRLGFTRQGDSALIEKNGQFGREIVDQGF